MHYSIFGYRGTLDIVLKRNGVERYGVVVTGFVNTTACKALVSNITITGLSGRGVIAEFIKHLIENLSSLTSREGFSGSGGYRVDDGPSYLCRDYHLSGGFGGSVDGCALIVRGCGTPVPAQASVVPNLRIPGIGCKVLFETLDIYMTSLKPQACFVVNSRFYRGSLAFMLILAALAAASTYLVLGQVGKYGRAP